MPAIGPGELDAFVAHVDSLGGPGFPAVDRYWEDFAYRFATRVDTDLDPFDKAYFDQQIALYEEIAGRPLDQSVNEHTIFDHARHLKARNPYDHGEPGVLATQIVQLATALRLAEPARGARVLDMGCGWGLSSELVAYAGLDVQAIDINPDFVALVRERSIRYGYDITAVHAGFDDFEPEQPIDLILFYECLHHAVSPWRVLQRLAKALVAGGRIVACGEPINTHWWPHWGLRLDPMSVYCIRKHGWFESGWSQDFILRCLERALLEARAVADPDPAIGSFLIATAAPLLSPGWMTRNCTIAGAALDGEFLVAGEQVRIAFNTGFAPGEAQLVLSNFRGRPVLASLRWNDAASTTLSLPAGELRVPIPEGAASLSIVAETWVPAEELGTADTRRLALHIAGIAVERSMGLCARKV